MQSISGQGKKKKKKKSKDGGDMLISHYFIRITTKVTFLLPFLLFP